MSKKKIGFMFMNVQHSSVLRPIYNEFAKHYADIEPLWGEVHTYEDVAKMYGGIYTIDADCYVFSGGERGGDLHKGVWSKCIYCPHGIGDENAPWWIQNEEYEHPAGILIPGPKWMDLYLAQRPDKEAHFKMVGYPKSDLLFSPEKDAIKKELETKLDLPFDKTILFSGFYFYTKEMLTLAHAMVTMLRVAAEKEYNLIIKPHISTLIAYDTLNHVPQPLDGYTTAKDMFDTNTILGPPYDRLKEYYDNISDRVRWINPFIPDITPLYLVSDLCVSGEGSSTLTEFMLLDRPIVGIMEAPEKTERITKGCTLATTQDLPETINHIFDNPNELQKYRKKRIEECVYKPDGHASERAAKAIIELMHW